jgi:cell division protein FtsI (penicillin-binding protein 3)
MEVETGKVRAMVNLRRTESGEYEDSYNYAIKDNIEPDLPLKPFPFSSNG